jgi:hypothetical protein
MVSTRKAKADVLDHIFQQICDLEEDSELSKACKHDGIKDVEALLSLNVLEIQDLTYKDGTATHKIRKGSQGLVFALIAFSLKRDTEGDSVNQEWTNASQGEFDKFRVSAEYKSARAGLPNPNAKPPPSAPFVPRPRDPLSEFRRTIRRDPSSFIPFKEDKQWDAWQRSTEAQARAQDLSDVLDKFYIPTTPEASELFTEKQKFMYAVFEKILLTDKGKALVRKHAATFDAQRVYKEISTYALTSTRASLEASKLLTYITSSRFGDGTWKGNAHGYILHWQDQIRQYEQILPTSGHFSAFVKRTMLENAVGQYPELRAVKTQAAQHKTQNGGIDLTYDEYCSLLMSAAQEYDGSLISSRKPPPLFSQTLHLQC